MKFNLIVLRHGKAEAHDPARDHGRTLVEEGREETAETVHALNGLLSEHVNILVISSDAARAKETADILVRDVRSKTKMILEPGFYEASAKQMQRCCLKHLDEPAPSFVAVVGHNPGISEFVGRLTGHYLSLKTGSAAMLETEAESWDVAMLAENWSLLKVIEPK
jgi:phosphohistidine phosphatase